VFTLARRKTLGGNSCLPRVVTLVLERVSKAMIGRFRDHSARKLLTERIKRVDCRNLTLDERINEDFDLYAHVTAEIVRPFPEAHK